MTEQNAKDIFANLEIMLCSSLNFSRLFPLPRGGVGEGPLPRPPRGKGKRRLKFRLAFAAASKTAFDYKVALDLNNMMLLDDFVYMV